MSPKTLLTGALLLGAVLLALAHHNATTVTFSVDRAAVATFVADPTTVAAAHQIDQEAADATATPAVRDWSYKVRGASWVKCGWNTDGTGWAGPSEDMTGEIAEAQSVEVSCVGTAASTDGYTVTLYADDTPVTTSSSDDSGNVLLSSDD